MKNFRFTANEAIGYLRIVRPGSVIGPQQHFLRDMQSRMWKAGDALRRQRSEINRNSRLYVSPPAQDSHTRASVPCTSLLSPLAALSLAGSQGWGPGKGSAVGFRNHSMNHDGKRENSGDTDCSNNSGSSRPSHVAMGGSISFKESREKPEMEASSEYRRSYSQGGLQSRSNVSQQSSRPSFSRGSSSLCLSTDTCLEQNRRPLSGNEAVRCPYNLRHRPSSTMQPSNADTHGIMRSKDMKPQAGEGICTQRTLNAAGQPRKVVVPMGHVGTKDSSPSRRRSSSPLRFSNNQQ